MIVSLKSLNKFPNTKVFIAAEKWMVGSTGVGGLISLRNGTCEAKNSWEFFVDAVFCFVKIFFQKRATKMNSAINKKLVFL